MPIPFGWCFHDVTVMPKWKVTQMADTKKPPGWAVFLCPDQWLGGSELEQCTLVGICIIGTAPPESKPCDKMYKLTYAMHSKKAPYLTIARVVR